MTTEDVEALLEFAKLEKSELKGHVQTLSFSQQLDNESLVLMEMDATVLSSLSQGDEVVIRGGEEDYAVLCTANRTYDIKEADISNSLLLVPGCVTGKDLAGACDTADIRPLQVCSMLHSYYELRRCKPRLKKLKELLEENYYSGKECEEDEDHHGNKYTFSDLLNSVQASQSEILEALRKLHACEIEGHWRLLEFDFLTKVLGHIISLSEENDWLSEGAPAEDYCGELEPLFPRSVLLHVLDCYGNKEDKGGKTVYVLNEDKVCRFFAELSLRHAEKFNFKEFLEVWKQSVPQGMKTSLYQLEGLALIDRCSRPEVIWFFPADNLPEDIGERLNFLFKTREKWTLDEITPYIRDLATEKVGVGALLMKYCRASMQNGIKVYNSKKPVT
ncbi:sister chromatid cohesion protein DCC1-like isoform X2 [Liolophura sinensis]|uniref:sister chromatid cohesion protein DCC1-like isoform X2 n=1 Tax=Liolophura sinensis TaxID=3198878 RepID=UPI0031583BB9